jgi:hypothetical protein
MAGYGMRDGSAIINAIGQYAQYAERREEREYQRERQERLDAENMRRQRLADERSSALFERQMSEYDHKEAERQRIADERQRLRDARQGYVDDVTASIDEQERAELNRFNRALTRDGGDIEVASNGDGTVSFGVLKSNGERAPLTVNPNDNTSTPLRAKEEDLSRLQAHAAKSIEVAEQNGIAPEHHAAYVRASFTADENGVVREASRDEFKENLKQQSLLNVAQDKQVSPNEDVPTEENLNRSAARQEAANEAKREGTRRLAGVSGRVAALEKAFGKKAHGDSARVSFKGDVAKVTPSNKVSTPEGAEDLAKTKEAIDQSGEAPPKVNRALEPIAQVEDVEQKMQAIKDKYAAKRKRAAVVGELYLTGNINEKQMRNYMDTGDMRFSTHDIEKHRADIYEVQANANAKVIKARKELLNAQVVAAKATTTNVESQQKALKDTRKYLGDVGASVAGYIGSIRGFKPAQIKGLESQINILADRFMANGRYSVEAMSTPEFAAMWSHGIESYLRAESNAELTVMSVTPYITAVEAKYKPETANTIKAVSAYSGLGVSEVRDVYNDRYNEDRAEFEQKGGQWNEAAQRDFDELFKETYLYKN